MHALVTANRYIGEGVKKVLFTCIVALVVSMTVCGMALADGGGLYVTAKGGVGFLRGDKSMSHNSTDATNDTTSWKSKPFSYGGAIGWNWLDQGAPIRTEVEYYDHGSIKMEHKDSNSTFTSPSTDIQTLQFNVYYDFYNSTSFIPYLGAGVGMAQLSTGGEKTSNISYSLFAGAGYKLTDDLLLDMSYRISQFGSGKEFKWSDTNNSYEGRVKNLYAIGVAMGLRYQF